MPTESRVFGPPGTGKTTWLARQVGLAAQARGSEAVIVASFTKAAAVELQDRELPLDDRNVGTLHALCYRQLDKPEIAETHIKEFNAAQEVYKLSGDSIDLDEPDQYFDTEADKLFAKYQVQRARQVPHSLWMPEIRAFAWEWEGWKDRNSYIDFTDMIEVALEAYVPPPAGAEIGFFDEVQDFTALELALIRQWGESLDAIVLAGDDDQCIYGFKGAAPDAFLNPPIADDSKRVLSQSYRLPAAVHRTTQEWIKQVRVREPKGFEPRDHEGKVDYRPDLRYGTAVTLVQDIIEASMTHSVMVIGACSYQLFPVVAALRAEGALFHNPQRVKRGDWNPIRSSRGRSTAQRMMSYLRLVDAPAPTWAFADLRDWWPLVKKTGVFRRGMVPQTIELQDDEMLISAEDLAALFEEGVMDAIRAQPEVWLADHLDSKKSKGYEYALAVGKRYGMDALENPHPNIVVGTIHSVKGGQADDVYLLPDLSMAGAVEYQNDRTRDGVIRQFYVGMSRARERLVLCGQSGPTAVRWL
jgi:superfamily I DNA/RNA helicase